MIKNRKKISTAELLFTIMFCMLYSYIFLETTTFNMPEWIKYLVYGFSFFLVMVKVSFFDKYSKINFFNMLIFSILTIVAAYFSRNYSLVILWIMVIGANNIDFEKIIRVFLIASVILLLGTLIASKYGLIMNFTYTRNGKIRNSFGANYPTDFGAHVLYIVLAYIYTLRGKLDIKRGLLVLLVGFFVIDQTDARLDAYLIIIVAIVFFIYNIAVNSIQGNSKLSIIAYIMAFSVPVAFVSSNLLTYVYTPFNNIMYKLNILFSARLVLGKQAFVRYPIKFFGQYIQQIGAGGYNGYMSSSLGNNYNYFFIDSSFVNMLLSYGILFSGYLVILISLRLVTKVKQGDYVLVLIFIFVTISSVVDQHFLEVAYNPFTLFIFSSMLYNKDVENEIREF